MRRRCYIIDPTVIYIPLSGKEIRLHSLMRYDYPTPVHFNTFDSTNILDLRAPSWHVIKPDLEMLATRPYRQKSPTRTFIK